MRIHRAVLWGAGALLGCGLVLGQEPSTAPALPPLPEPQRVPTPGATNDAPYVPQPILPGGVVIPL